MYSRIHVFSILQFLMHCDNLEFIQHGNPWPITLIHCMNLVSTEYRTSFADRDGIIHFGVGISFFSWLNKNPQEFGYKSNTFCVLGELNEQYMGNIKKWPPSVTLG